MPLDLPNTAQIFREREQLHQVCSTVVFVFSVLDHLWLLPREAAFALPNFLQEWEGMGGGGSFGTPQAFGT